MLKPSEAARKFIEEKTMIQKLKLTFLLFLCAAAFGISKEISAQTVGDSSVAAANSKLATVSLPPNARRINDESVPQEIKDTFAKIFAAGDGRVQQGDVEVIIWGGNYSKSNGEKMMKNLENSLKNSGWEYDISAQQSDFTLFGLFRDASQKRALVGFFAATEDAFVFALAEMIPANAPVVTENQKPKK